MSSQAGIAYFDGRPVPAEIITALQDALAPSDTDARGSITLPGLFMAHATLWLDDIARGEQQPLTAPSGIVCTFDGRLDNRNDLLLQLRDRSMQRTDASLALAAYEMWGEEGLVQLIGDWSLAAWEPATRSLVLASDYAGIRPLYYHANHERVIWSSYLRPLVALVGGGELDDGFVAGYLTGTPTPCHTPYRDILLVPSGQSVRCNVNGITARTFWQVPVHDRIRYSDEREYEVRLRELFRESVQTRLRTTYPICSELSGGLDSSSIVCMASHIANHSHLPPITTLSFGPAGHPDEKFFRIVQQFCEMPSRYIDTDDFPFLLPEQMHDAVPAPWGALFDELHRHVNDVGARTYMTGQGGDLLMGNFQDDCEQLAAPLRVLQWKASFREAIGWSKATRLPVGRILWRGILASTPAQWNLARYKAEADPALPERFGNSLTPRFEEMMGLRDPDTGFSKTWQRALPEKRKLFRSVARLMESGIFRPPERMQHLHYVHPYAHRPLVEFMLGIPADQLCRPDEPRRLMRRAFAQLLPPEIVRRRSKGSFTSEFLKTVRPAAKTLLNGQLQVVERGYVEPTVRERIERITQSLDCNEPQLRHVIMLELWLRAQTERHLQQQPLAKTIQFDGAVR